MSNTDLCNNPSNPLASPAAVNFVNNRSFSSLLLVSISSLHTTDANINYLREKRIHVFQIFEIQDFINGTISIDLLLNS